MPVPKYFLVFFRMKQTSAQDCSRLRSLSTRDFETRTATGSYLFSLLTCPLTTTFTLLSIFSPLEMSRIKIWVTIGFKHAKCSLPVAVRVARTRVLNALISGHPGGLTPGNPQAFAPRHLRIPPTQGQYSSTESFHCPFPGEHNLKKNYG